MLLAVQHAPLAAALSNGGRRAQNKRARRLSTGGRREAKLRCCRETRRASLAPALRASAVGTTRTYVQLPVTLHEQHGCSAGHQGSQSPMHKVERGRVPAGFHGLSAFHGHMALHCCVVLMHETAVGETASVLTLVAMRPLCLREQHAGYTPVSKGTKNS